MQRWEGGLRIIHVDGRVEWASNTESTFENADGCTSRGTQKSAYQACIEYDRYYSGFRKKDNVSWLPMKLGAFLGYL
jgi:hypothetical protein